MGDVVVIVLDLFGAGCGGDRVNTPAADPPGPDSETADVTVR
jgi:hypothetical protein